MNLKYICPYWGQEDLNAKAFIEKVVSNDFDGIEINIPCTGDFKDELVKEIDKLNKRSPGFIFIPQQLTAPGNEPIEAYIKRMKALLLELSALQPAFINAHTGRDYYSFADNCRLIEACMNISQKTGTRILHETHRGRFSFHAATLIPYLEKFPEIELTADFSHFCSVSESLLQGQEDLIKKIIPHVSYIHARVGHEQGAQVNHPFAPEWNNHLNRFVGWWEEIIFHQNKKGKTEFFICPEFGPAPYMPCLPFTRQPIANQWQINTKMKEYLAQHFKEALT